MNMHSDHNRRKEEGTEREREGKEEEKGNRNNESTQVQLCVTRLHRPSTRLYTDYNLTDLLLFIVLCSGKGPEKRVNNPTGSSHRVVAERLVRGGWLRVLGGVATTELLSSTVGRSSPWFLRRRDGCCYPARSRLRQRRVGLTELENSTHVSPVCL